jgi:cyclopropane fatty-acyl-phospholipid synthase-like methyltransferase
MDYNQQYTSDDAIFGDQPEKLLSDNYRLIDNSRPILDIGAGQGRHSLFLARNGYAVEALEPSEIGLKQIEENADLEDLPVFCSLGDISSFEPKTDAYSAVLIFGLLQILKRDEIDFLVKQLEHWAGQNSLLFITVFSIKDPSFEKNKKEDKEIGHNSFEDKSGNVRTYFEEDEILQLFSDFENIELNSRITPDHHHGDGKTHQHHIIEGIFKRK